jgi:YD repeat-containing protein
MRKGILQVTLIVVLSLQALNSWGNDNCFRMQNLGTAPEVNTQAQWFACMATCIATLVPNNLGCYWADDSDKATEICTNWCGDFEPNECPGSGGAGSSPFPGGGGSSPAPGSGGNRSYPTNTVGNPINLTTGAKMQSESDYADYAHPHNANFPLSLNRYYNSRAIKHPGQFGSNWRSNYDRLLEQQTAGDGSVYIYAYRPQGKRLRFLSDGANGWSSLDGAVDQLTSVIENDVVVGYQLLNTQDETETYDINGVLQSITNKFNQTHTLTYLDGLLHQVTDQTGRYIEFAYHSYGYVQTATFPGDTVFSYDYGTAYTTSWGVSSRPLTRVTYADKTPGDDTDNPYKEYLYEATISKGALTGIIDENSDRYATYGYDAGGRANLSVHGTHDDDGVEGTVKDNADKYTVTYTPSTYANMTAVVVNPGGLETTYSMSVVNGTRKITDAIGSPAANCAGSDAGYTYDTNGNWLGKRDWNNVITDITVSDRKLITSQTEALTTDVERTTETDWHPTLRLPEEIRKPNLTINFTYENGRIKTRTETDTTNHSVPYSTFGRTRTWTYSYTYFDTEQTQLETASVDGPRNDVNDVTTYRFNESGWLIETENALGHTVAYLAHNTFGQPTSIQDQNGVVTSITYHPRGWMETRTVQSASGNATTTIEYEPTGMIDKMTTADGVTLDYDYDTAHRLNKITNSIGETIEYELDGFGNITKETVSNTNSQIKKSIEKQFDALGRLWKEIAVEGHDLHDYRYDNNSNLVEDYNANSVAKIQGFDELNRLRSILDRESGTVEMDYDAHNNLIKVTDQNLLSTDYVVDGFGYRIQETSPDRGVTIYQFDLAGNMTSIETARGLAESMTYDALNRIETSSIAGHPEDNITYTYDETSTQSEPNKGIGKLTQINQGNGDYQAFIYDDLGRVNKRKYDIDGFPYQIIFDHNLSGQVTGITYPSGRIVTYYLDSLARVERVTTKENASASEQTVVENIQYYPFGPLSKLTFGNGFVLNKTFDAHYRSDTIATAVGNSSILNLDYGYDARGNINSIGDAIFPEATQGFGYDELSRITSASGSYGAFGYTLDPVGNREAVTWEKGGDSYTETYVTDTAITNQLDSYQRVGFGDFAKDYDYSATGNTEFDGAHTFEYDSRDRLTNVLNGVVVVAEYDHNALGERVSKAILADPSKNRHFHYNSWRLLSETLDSGAKHRDYIYVGDMMVAMIDADDQGAIDQVDLLTKIVGNSGEFEDGSVSYRLTVTNLTAVVDASDVVVTNNIATGVTLTSIVPSQGSCNAEGTVCNLGVLGGDASASIEITVSQPEAGVKSYSSAVTTSSGELYLSNNEVSGSFGAAPANPGICPMNAAASGTYAEASLDSLRGFRDSVLAQSDWGRNFTVSYYAKAPAVTQWLTINEWAKPIIRAAIVPVGVVSEWLTMIYELKITY